MINENTIHEESSSSFPKGLEEFRQNIKNKDNSSDIYCHNLYLLQTTDRDGNVTGEAYGMNLMTNWGFKNIYTSTTSYETNCKIYIGNGTDEPVLTNNALYSPIITTGSTNVNTSYSIYPFQYDSSTGIITGIQRIYQGYFDYNISGITEDFEITEIGYGTSKTQLVSHARIYDSEGNPSSITKRINERLTINVFWTLNMKESIIQSNYENGVYIVMRPAFSGLLTKTYRCTLYTIYGSQKIGCTESYSNNMYHNVATLLDDNNVKSTIKPNSLLIENQRSYISDIVAVDQRKSTTSNYAENITGEFNFMIMTKDKLPTPEEITTYEAYTDGYASNSFSNIFGSKYDSSTGAGELPCTNFNITSLSMYNHLTKEWDIEEEFVSDPNVELDNTWRSFVRIYTTINGINCPVWVYVNTRTDLPITSFNNTNIVLYATDKYWDTSTWELISNLSNVDESLQCKRYYIRTTETNESSKYILYPYRNMVYHRIDNIRDSYTITSITPEECYKYHGYYDHANINSIVINLSSDEYGWVLFGQKLIYPNIQNQPVYTLNSPEVNFDQRYKRFDQYCQWTTGDLIILTIAIHANLYFRIYNVSDSSIEPTYNDIKLKFTGVSDNVHHLGYNTLYRTFTHIGSGFLACQRYNSDIYNECVIINLHGTDGVPTQILLENVKHCTIMNLTTNCVYLNVTDNKYEFEVYDMENNEVIYRFKLPITIEGDSGNTVVGIIAWKNYVYIQVNLNGSRVTYLHDINTSKTIQLLENIPQARTVDTYSDYGSGGYQVNNMVRISCVDECMVITSYSTSEKNLIIKYDEPTKPIALNLNSNRAIDVQLKYCNDGKQLVCLITTSWSRYSSSDPNYYYNFIFDMGLFLDKGSYNVPFGRYNEILLYYGTYVYYGYNSGVIFDDGFVCCNYAVGYPNDTRPITWSDIACVLPHKIVGTTTTIQSWNNPKRLQNKEYSFTLTNDTTNWGDDTNV